MASPVLAGGGQDGSRQEDARQIAAAGGVGAHGSRSQHRSLQRQMDQMAPGFTQDTRTYFPAGASASAAASRASRAET